MVVATAATVAASALGNRKDGGDGDTIVVAPQNPTGGPVIINAKDNGSDLRTWVVKVLILAALAAIFAYVGWLLYNAALDRLDDLLDSLTGLATGGLIGALNPFNSWKERAAALKEATGGWDGSQNILRFTPLGFIFRLFGR
jgi:hypothetical protein